MYLFLQTYGGFTAMPLARTHFFSQDTSKKKQHEFFKQTKQLGKKTEGVKARRRPQKSHGREPPHAPPPTTPAYDPPTTETATACTTGAADATGGGNDLVQAGYQRPDWPGFLGFGRNSGGKRDTTQTAERITAGSLLAHRRPARPRTTNLEGGGGCNE